MRAAISIYEHPDFSDAPSPLSRDTVYTVVGALTAFASSIAIYRLASDAKPFDTG
jgi:hypothetical protein